MFYNCHTHVFLDKDVPEKFLPFGLVKLAKKPWASWIIRKILRNILPFTDKDLLDRYARYIKTGGLGSQKKVFEAGLKSYPKDTKFIILPMDMAYMGAGRVPREYKNQIKELANLKKAYPDNVVPFFHVDPRRKGVVRMLKTAVEKQGFMGVKLYPPLGYFPYDPRMDKVYEYCQEKNIPVLAHCSSRGAVSYKGKKKTLIKMLKDGNPNITDTKGKDVKDLCSMFTHPNNYLEVIKKYPKLRICFAHFGSDNSWARYLDKGEEKNSWFLIIKDLIQKYPNFYTDVSFTMNDKRFFPLLKKILINKKVRDKVLFGSDYYMVQIESDEKRFGKDLRKFIGEDLFESIAVKNPKKFLGR